MSISNFLVWKNAVLLFHPQISLFLDVLKCLCSDLTQDQFVSEERAGCSSAVGPQGAAVRSGRSELWRILRGAPLRLGGCVCSPVCLSACLSLCPVLCLHTGTHSSLWGSGPALRPLLDTCGSVSSAFTQVLYLCIILRYLYFTWIFPSCVTLYFSSATSQGAILYFLLHDFVTLYFQVINTRY